MGERLVVESLLDCEEPVVFCGAVAAARRSDFDLCGVDADGEVRYECVFCFPASVADHDVPPGALS